MTNPTLLERAAGGDREAAAALLEEQLPACLRVAGRLLGNAQDAEDAVQETCLRAFRALPRLRPEIPFRPWLFRILLNQCHSMSRWHRRRDRRLVVDSDTVARTEAAPAALGMDVGVIMTAVDALSPRLREAFVLKYIENLEYQEIAMITGATIPALKMRCKRACDLLRPRLEELFRDHA